MEIAINLLHPDAQMPTKAHDSDAAFDLTSTSIVRTKEYVEYGTGIQIAIPKGYVGLIFPRSSVSNRRLSLANSVGVIDPGYIGEIKLRFYNVYREVIAAGATRAFDNEYLVGDRVGQLIIIKNEEVHLKIYPEAFDATFFERGEGGFGSTGT